MPDPKPEIIESLASGLRLVALLADPYEPRTFTAICELAKARGFNWSSTKIHGMIGTLCHEGWLERTACDQIQICPAVARICIAYQTYLREAAERVWRIQQSIYVVPPTPQIINKEIVPNGN